MLPIQKQESSRSFCPCKVSLFHRVFLKWREAAIAMEGKLELALRRKSRRPSRPRQNDPLSRLDRLFGYVTAIVAIAMPVHAISPPANRASSTDTNMAGGLCSSETSASHSRNNEQRTNDFSASALELAQDHWLKTNWPKTNEIQGAQSCFRLAVALQHFYLASPWSRRVAARTPRIKEGPRQRQQSDRRCSRD